jgi:carbonic anhydrase
MSVTDELLRNAEQYAEGFSDDEFRRQVQTDTGIKPEWAAEAFDDLEEDVRQSIARIKSSPFIPRKDSVRGFVYDVKTGRLDEVK